jgi:hypothetical protein
MLTNVDCMFGYAKKKQAINITACFNHSKTITSKLEVFLIS